MATTIDPEAQFFGAPVSLMVGGIEVGATIDAPKISIVPDVYTPKYQNAKSPIRGTDIVTWVLVSCEFTVNEFTAAKMALALPGATLTGDTITWEPGRVPSSAYKELVLIEEGLDGRSLVLAIHDAISLQPLEITFGNTEVAGFKMKFEGRADPASPGLIPFSLEMDLGS